MKRLIWILLACCLLATACVAPPAAEPAATATSQLPTATPLSTATALPEPTPTIPTYEAPIEVVKTVLDAVAQMYGTDAAQVEVVTVEEVQWPDSCLGVNKTDEMCLQVITPGYRIILRVNGQQVEVHTNADASAIRLASP